MPNIIDTLYNAFFALSRACSSFWDIVTTPFKEVVSGNVLGLVVPLLPDVIQNATILEASLMGFAVVYVCVCIAKFFTDAFGL